jgi:hypothetical protein
VRSDWAEFGLKIREEGQSRDGHGDRRFYGAGVGGGLSGADSGLAFSVIEVMGTGTCRTCGESRCRGCEVDLPIVLMV